MSKILISIFDVGTGAATKISLFRDTTYLTGPSTAYTRMIYSVNMAKIVIAELS